jgi:hypothetical protein
MSTDRSLVLSSNFESGNCVNPVEIAPDHWQFKLHGDIIYEPWYFFELKDFSGRDHEVKIDIIDIPTQVINQADRPVFQVNGGAWQRLSLDRVSTVNTEKKSVFEEPLVWFWEREEEPPVDRRREFSTSELNLCIFVPANSTVRVACTYPFIYEQLVDWINNLNGFSGESKKLLKIEIIGKSEESRDIFMINLTDPVIAKKQKQVILITARMHPSTEASGSYSAQAIVDFLLSDSTRAKKIMNEYDVYVIPLVNPDGVVEGEPHYNSRDVDIWIDFEKKCSIEAWVVLETMHKVNPDYYIDFHGWLHHSSGKWPYDGGYFDVQTVREFDAFYNGKIAEALKKRVNGLGSYALYHRLDKPSSPATVYRELHTLACALEINSVESTVEEVKSRAVDSFIGICEVMSWKWSGYPVPGVPNRIIIENNGIALMAWGDDYEEIRRSRVELWRNLDRIKLEVGAEENKKVLKIISDLKRSVKAALRWSISQDNQLEVIVNEKICKDSVVVEDNGGVWLFIPLELKNKETRVEIERKK